MKHKTYKYALSLTSQIYFCSIPVRLDSYNHCNYGCGYCFASTRQGFGRDQTLKLASPKALDRRLTNAAKGTAKSALDDFLSHRVPIQFGGMSDPFSEAERRNGVSIQLMHILAKHRYPYIISTKGTLLANQEYLDILRDSNVYVRFSVTVVAPELRKGIDRGCPNLCDLFAAAKTICQVGVPVSFRLQPIFPGHEDVAYALLEEAGKMGVKHISMEYLKVPIDANIKFSETVRAALGSEPIRRYIEMGSKRNGREYILPFRFDPAHAYSG